MENGRETRAVRARDSVEASHESTRVLLIEDSPDDALLVEEELHDVSPSAFELNHVQTWADAQAQLLSHHFDVIVLDLSLPDGRGLELVSNVVAVAPDTPIVISTGFDDQHTALSALHLGVQDYLVKGRDFMASGPSSSSALPRTLRYAIQRQSILRALEESQRKQLATKDEFLSHVSHELRTPLTAIHQFVSLVLDGLAGEISKDQQEFLEIALRNVNQLGEMIQDLMEVTRAEAGKLNVEPAPMRVTDVAASVVAGLRGSAERRGLTVECERPPLPRVYADEGRVRQIVGNLLQNAIKFTESGGRISVRACIDSEDGNFIRVSVQDTGRGISAEGTRRIFERLYQEPGESGSEESRKGLGLGLYICRELVRRQNGRIWVESELRRGSTFHFTLPIFSIAQFLRPIMVEGETLRQNLAMIEVTIASTDPTASLRIGEHVIRKVHEVLKGCVFPDLDVVLPRLRREGVGERLYVAAATDDTGLAALASRIERLLERCPETHEPNVRVYVRTRQVPVPEPKDWESNEDAVEAAGREFARIMYAE